MPNLLWVATYSDGRQITESPQISYSNLDRVNLQQFSLIDETGKPHATMKLEPAEVVFYRRRTFALGTPNQYSIYLLGTRRREGSHILNRIQVLMPAGTILHDSAFHKEWYEPQWLPQEEV